MNASWTKRRARWLGAALLAGALPACGPRPMVSDSYANSPSSDGAFDYRKYIDGVYNAHNPEAVEQFFTSDVVVHNLAPDGEDGKGVDYLKQLAKGILEAFPDVRLTVQEVVREGDRLSARVLIEGTHKGEFAGIKPTGRTVKVTNFAMYRLQGDKIAEVWSLTDVALLRLQLTEPKQ